MKRKITAILLLFVFAVSVAGCSQTKEIDANALAAELLNNGVYAEELSAISSQIAEKRYALSEDEVEEAVAYAGTNAVVDEIAIFKAKDVESVSDMAEKHIAGQIKTYESYRPSEVSKLEDCVITVAGDYVIVCVSEDSTKAKEIIEEYTK